MTPPRPRSTIPGRKAWAEGDDRLAVDAGPARRRGPGRARGRGREVPKPALLTSRSTSTPSFSTSSGQRCRLGPRGRRRRRGLRSGARSASCSRRSAAAGDQDQVVAARGELARELFANSRGCARDEGRFRHGLTLFSFRRWQTRFVRARGGPGQVAGGSGSLLGGGVPVGPGDAVVSGGAPGAGARQPDAHAVSARSGPDRALEGVPAAQAQDAGVHRAGGRPLPDAAHAHARDVRDRADGCAGAGAERGPDRGDRARARPRASAVRAHRRGGARRGAAGAGGAELPAQRAVAAGGGRAGARRAGAQPDRAGARRDPQSHRVGASR